MDMLLINHVHVELSVDDILLLKYIILNFILIKFNF